MSYYGGWAPYVPVAERRRRALVKMSKLREKGLDVRPINIVGRKITKTFWGQAWCAHIESLGDFDNRLPRGRTYVRNGSVCHLAIDRGQIKAMVSGSSLYEIKVEIDVLPKKKWNKVKDDCAGQISSLLELLRGRFSDQVMGVVTDSSSGLFPLEKEIRLGCNCPDWAVMCKHVAAVLYGVGARLDEQPELLFLLRGVKHEELIGADTEDAINRATRRGGRRPTLATSDLSDVFGIELDSNANQEDASVGCKKQTGPKTRRSSTKKRAPVKKKKSKPKTAPRKSLEDKNKPSTKSATKKRKVKTTKSARKKSVTQKSRIAKKKNKKKTGKKKTPSQ